MATYNYINLGSNEESTENFKLALMGSDYQTTDIIYRANLEKLAILTEALVMNSPASSPSGEVSRIGIKDSPVRRNDIDVISRSTYSNKASQDGNSRVLYLVKED